MSLIITSIQVAATVKGAFFYLRVRYLQENCWVYYWQATGIPTDQAVISAPEVQDFQSAQTFRAGDALQIPAKEGLLLLITPSGK